MKNILLLNIILWTVSATIKVFLNDPEWFSRAFLALMLISAYIITETIEGKNEH